MAKIVWTEESLNWLELIADYISQDNPAAAVRTLEGIYNKVQLLEQNPELGFRYEPIIQREIRIILYGHYRIAYDVTADKDVCILGVFHAALDVERYLKD
jgi:plasmid stabilization system protein ParE